MTQAENVVAYLWSVLPDGATNSEIAESFGIGSHQIVFMITRDLMRRGLIRGDREGRTWTFYGVEDPAALLAGRARWPRGAEWSGGTMSPAGFEALAGRRLSERYGVALSPGSVSGVHSDSILCRPTDRSSGTRSITRSSAASLCRPPNSQSSLSMFGFWRRLGHRAHSSCSGTTGGSLRYGSNGMATWRAPSPFTF